MSFGKPQDNLKTNPYAALAHNYSGPAAQADVSDRVTFIRRTYMHLAAAVSTFIMLEVAIFSLFGDQILPMVQNTFTGMGWLVVMGAFMGASWLASNWAHSNTSVSKQYLGLGLYVLAWTAIFVPILAIAKTYYPGAILTASTLTIIAFAGLTLTVFVTKADFSFLRPALVVGSLVSIAAMIIGIVFSLPIFGVLFMSAMVLFSVGVVLYDTSRVLHNYRTDQYVGAALSLFSGLAMMFYYILQLVMAFSRD